MPQRGALSSMAGSLIEEASSIKLPAILDKAPL